MDLIIPVQSKFIKFSAESGLHFGDCCKVIAQMVDLFKILTNATAPPSVKDFWKRFKQEKADFPEQ